MAYTYMLRCADNSLYTGWTLDLEQRLSAHNKGKGAKYTRARLPVRLAWSYCTEDKREAQRLEARIKRLTKLQKERLAARPELLHSICADFWEG